MLLHNDSLITSTLGFMFVVDNCTVCVCVHTCEKQNKSLSSMFLVMVTSFSRLNKDQRGLHSF